MATQSRKKMRIGVLDIQGSVEEHLGILACTGVEPVSVKTVEALETVDGLILPGGESTTISLLCEKFGLHEKLVEKVRSGFPVYGTCAGAILLSRWGLLDVEVLRNAYGRQIDSFDTEIFCELFDHSSLPAIFIRAPKIISIHPNVRVLAKFDGAPVLVRQDNVLASTFHPELTGDLRVHRYFAQELVSRRLHKQLKVRETYCT